jgi:polysaccharide export outer membrane protein
MAPADAPEEKAYRIGAGDVLEVRFERVPELNVTVPVRPDGRITLERARDLVAEGRTPRELEQSLQSAYRGYLLHPDVAIIVREFAAQRAYVGDRAVGGWASQLADVGIAVRSSVPRQVFVAGEVRNPGFVNYQAPLTLMQAIVASGGTPRSAHLGRVMVLRKVGTDEPTATFVDLTRELGGRLTSDMPLRPYDIVVVPKTRIARVTDFLDQYLYQLVPATRNVNFTYFYSFDR